MTSATSTLHSIVQENRAGGFPRPSVVVHRASANS
jgi:hypothetical protein